MNKHLTVAIAACLLSCTASAAAPQSPGLADGRAGSISVRVTNLTSHTWLAPLLVAGSARNFKLTYAEDFELAEALLARPRPDLDPPTDFS